MTIGILWDVFAMVGMACCTLGTYELCVFLIEKRRHQKGGRR